MLRVRIFKKEAVDVAKEDLELLLDEAGCVDVDEEESGEEEFTEVISDELDNDEGDREDSEDDDGGEEDEEGDEEENQDVTLIVILTPECVDDPDLVEAVGKAVGSGGRAVGVWPKGSSEGQLPPILDKIGSGTVIWDPKELASVLTDTETVWDTPTGEPRPAPKTKRNKC